MNQWVGKKSKYLWLSEKQLVTGNIVVYGERLDA